MPSKARKQVGADERLAGGLDPVLGEDPLQRPHRRALDPRMGVAPVVGAVGVAGPLVRDSHPAGKANPAVDDQHPAVAAVRHPAQQVRLRRAEADDVGAALAQLADQTGSHLRGADGIEQHPAGDPGPRPLEHRLGDLVGDLAAPVDVGLEVDRLLGAADRLEDRGEDLLSVEQHLHPVAVARLLSGQGLGRAQEVVAGGRRGLERLVAFAVVAAMTQGLARVPAEPEAAEGGGPGDPAPERHLAGARRSGELREALLHPITRLRALASIVKRMRSPPSSSQPTSSPSMLSLPASRSSTSTAEQRRL